MNLMYLVSVNKIFLRKDVFSLFLVKHSQFGLCLETFIGLALQNAECRIQLQITRSVELHPCKNKP